MKRYLSSSVIVILSFLLVSCSESMEQAVTNSRAYLEHRTLLTKAATDALSAGVTAEDVENYLTCRMNVPTSDESWRVVSMLG